MKNFLKKEIVIFIIILCLGIFPRVLYFGYMPIGMHQDEAANGVDAYDVLTYHVDRTGTRFPMQFISWGSGQSALYAYSAMPFIQIWGLKQTTIRIPNMIAGILMLPLAYLAGKKMLGSRFGFIFMFLVAISPWNIMGSRWGLEAYFVPFLVMVAFTCYVYAANHNYWFEVGSFFLGISTYAYSTTFLVAPVFFVLTAFLFWKTGKLNLRHILSGAAIAILVNIPMILFMAVNSFGLEQMRFLKMTIPKLPIGPRYETTVSIFQKNSFELILQNAMELVNLLWTQDDKIIWNRVVPFGFLYPGAIIFSLIGAVLSVYRYIRKRDSYLLMTLFWFFTSLLIGIMQIPNIHRLSLLFIPMTICIALLLEAIANRKVYVFASVAAAYLVGFCLFCFSYFGEYYQSELSTSARYDVLSAIKYTKEYPEHQVCITEDIHESNIFVLFIEKPNPDSYLKKSGYIDSDEPFVKPGYLQRYVFYLDNCDNSKKTIYLLKEEEPPVDGRPIQFRKRFGAIRAYISE